MLQHSLIVFYLPCSCSSSTFDFLEEREKTTMSRRQHAAAREAMLEMAEAEETIMNRAMTKLTEEMSEITFDYRQACRFVPELVDKESNPCWFLR
jgi:hypothetical protein